MLQSCTMPLACSVGCVAGCAAACSPGRSVIRDWPLELQPKRPTTQRKHNGRRDAEKVFRTTVLQSIQCNAVFGQWPLDNGSFIRRDTRVYCCVVARRVECNNHIYNIT